MLAESRAKTAARRMFWANSCLSKSTVIDEAFGIIFSKSGNWPSMVRVERTTSPTSNKVRLSEVLASSLMLSPARAESLESSTRKDFGIIRFEEVVFLGRLMVFFERRKPSVATS